MKPAKQNQMSPLERLEAIRDSAAEMIENYDRFPEAYQPGSQTWNAYESIEEAHSALSEAFSGLM